MKTETWPQLLVGKFQKPETVDFLRGHVDDLPHVVYRSGFTRSEAGPGALFAYRDTNPFYGRHTVVFGLDGRITCADERARRHFVYMWNLMMGSHFPLVDDPIHGIFGRLKELVAEYLSARPDFTPHQMPQLRRAVTETARAHVAAAGQDPGSFSFTFSWYRLDHGGPVGVSAYLRRGTEITIS